MHFRLRSFIWSYLNECMTWYCLCTVCGVADYPRTRLAELLADAVPPRIQSLRIRIIRGSKFFGSAHLWKACCTCLWCCILIFCQCKRGSCTESRGSVCLCFSENFYCISESIAATFVTIISEVNKGSVLDWKVLELRREVAMPLRIFCCSKCTLRTKSLVAYVDHCKLHSNVPNAAFPCGVSRCIQTFKTFAGFKSHMTRCHGSIRNAVRYEQTYREGAGPSYECAVLHCKQICHSLSNFIVHIKDHINTKTAVACPFLSCHTKFEDVKVSIFNVHLSGYHKGWAHRTVDDR